MIANPLPMLAHNFKMHGHKITYPAFAQPKLDGFRMLMDGNKSWGRSGKETIADCTKHLIFDTGGYTIDGELILPKNRPLQETASAAKKFHPGISPNLVYQIYDIISDAPFKERYKILAAIWASTKNDKIILVPTIEVKSAEDVKKCHKRFTSDGYEGTIVRADNIPYQSGERSYSLQKYKDFVDGEFKIMNVLEGKGRDHGLAIFECCTKRGEIFRVRPAGNNDYRADLLANRTKLPGKLLTVRYQSLSNRGVPIFPVGICIRDYE